MYNYNDWDEESKYNRVLENIGHCFTGVFVLECMLKIIGFGFVADEYTYLRDPWNFLDFIIVISG